MGAPPAYGVSQMSSVACNDVNIAVVDFSGLSPAQKVSALRRRIRHVATCGCGMTLTECVVSTVCARPFSLNVMLLTLHSPSRDVRVIAYNVHSLDQFLRPTDDP